MSDDLLSPVVFVAGGSGGLGSAICRRLAELGNDLFLTYRTRKIEAERLAAELGSSGVRAAIASVDLAEPEAISLALEAAQEMGCIAAVVYASGPSIPQTWFSKVSAETWHANVTSELTAFFNLASLALPHLRVHGGALVATTSSATGRVIPGDVLSAVPKAGIEMLMRQIAREEGRFGIRANCVAPGIIDAGLGLKAQADHYTTEIWEGQRQGLPLRRFGTADAIADAVAYLISRGADYVTGQTIYVDGGLSV
jgi:NAD(P)-dependent dehydrogenase (short-subunit alcohol dehydrogenase family)